MRLEKRFRTTIRDERLSEINKKEDFVRKYGDIGNFICSIGMGGLIGVGLAWFTDTPEYLHSLTKDIYIGKIIKEWFGYGMEDIIEGLSGFGNSEFTYEVGVFAISTIVFSKLLYPISISLMEGIRRSHLNYMENKMKKNEE